jgi:hypothetical protein
MTSGSDPQRSDDRSDVERDEGGLVLPFPLGGRDGRQQSDASWTFTTKVSWVGAAEGMWLRRELASVLRDLLGWARQDMAADEVQGEVIDDMGDERAA